MEAEYVRERRRRRTVVILGVILAILAAAATYYLVTQRGGGGGAGEIPKKTIVVAAAPIVERETIEPADVRTTEVADSEALATAATSVEQVIGQLARINIAPGSPILAGMYGQGTTGGLEVIPPGEELTPDSPDYRAVSVEMTDERAVGGKVARGDRVDLFATMEIKVFDPTGLTTDQALLPEGYYSDFTTKIAWANLEVLSADAENDMYVLRVDEHQAEEIAHIQGSGAENSFTMSLRAAADARELDRSGYGETTNRILEQYNYPIPQIINLEDYPNPSPQPPPFVPGVGPAPSSPGPSSPAPSSPGPVQGTPLPSASAAP
jgi:Flp pilus assembly protein CpaB